MANLPKDEERARLEQEIETKEYRPSLQRLQRECAFFRDFSTWGDIVAFMRGGSSRDPMKDEILRPILAAHAEDSDPRWRTILLVFFWPGLKSICIKRRGWDPEFESLWSNAVWIFLQAVCRLDLSKRPGRLVQKLVNDTISRLGADYRRARDQSAVEIPTNPGLIECLAGGVEDPGLDELDFRDDQELRIEKYRAHLEAGCISETDFTLLVGTRIYCKALRECAEELGLTYQAAKKRRQRAEASIRQSDESE